MRQEAIGSNFVASSSPVVGDVVVVRKEISAHIRGYLVLARGDVVRVQYVGANISNDAGWLFGDCPPGNMNEGWLPAAMMFPRESIVVKVRLALSGEVLDVIELQPSDTLDTLPLAVSTITPC